MGAMMARPMAMVPVPRPHRLIHDSRGRIVDWTGYYIHWRGRRIRGHHLDIGWRGPDRVGGLRPTHVGRVNWIARCLGIHRNAVVVAVVTMMAIRRCQSITRHSANHTANHSALLAAESLSDQGSRPCAKESAGNDVTAACGGRKTHAQTGDCKHRSRSA